MKTKTLARIDAQYSRLWLAASGNKVRQDRICAVWMRYAHNIHKHFNVIPLHGIISGAKMFEAETTELPRAIYAGY